MKIVIGPGNPGKKYQFTRHNMGFLTVDAFAIRHGCGQDKFQNLCIVKKTVIKSEQVILAKPETFMNLSGNAVKELVNYYKVSASDTLIVYDDINFDLGNVKLRKTGGAGSHNGIESIINALKTNNFPRLKMGIGPRDDLMELSDFVLKKITKDEMPEFKKMIDLGTSVIDKWITDGIDAAMNEYN